MTSWRQKRGVQMQKEPVADSSLPTPLRPTAAMRESIRIPEDRSYLIRRDDYPHPLCTWNYHPEWEIHFVPHARGFAYVGDYIGSFEPGHIALCGGNLPHNWVSPGLIAPGRDYVLQFDAGQLLSKIPVLAELRSLQALVQESERGIELMGREAAEAGALMIELEQAPPARGLGLFVEILSRFATATDYRLLASPGFATGYAALASGRHARVNNAVQLVQSNPSISMNEAADIVGAEASTFSRSFKALTGMTFSHYQRAIRISRARSLLAETARPITEVCFEAGFSNLSNFNRIFLKEAGMTPREYRKIANIRTISRLRTDEDGD
ncbi:AraC family transcriptional regulator (plasmid) [Gemmobacter fulvus]|uniref:AraC family transcriptional regulator n=2 Tax=Gemmobacter fulvus TaxID=2840474 RepID=A0A975PBI1_9RHOB|nr:AraC family transcriptional regulator [Gemmobacter fulvus]QWK92096.1 AraC family transcriptional regulator [Gemmobacter fulvus]